MIKPIKTFAINLKERSDRRLHILEQFKEKDGFDLEVVDAIKDKIGAIGLWKTVKQIISTAQEARHPLILICEDDHTFTDSFEYPRLIKTIHAVQSMDADLLLGGLSNFEDGIPLSNGMFWVSSFTGFQFGIVFEKFYPFLLSLNLENHENIDIKMKELSTSIFCMYPFISVQTEFGYSDVTERNGVLGVVDNYFKDASKRMEILLRLKNHFKNNLD